MPILGAAEVLASQACHRPITADGLPLIGPVPQLAGAYVATGHSVWGMLNAPGTVDSDYRGEVKVILINLGDVPFVVTRGMRVAQMVIARHLRADFVEAETLSETARGAGGHGSTGLNPFATSKSP